MDLPHFLIGSAEPSLGSASYHLSYSLQTAWTFLTFTASGHLVPTRFHSVPRLFLCVFTYSPWFRFLHRCAEVAHRVDPFASLALRVAWFFRGAISESGLDFAPVWTRQVRNLGPDSGTLALVSMGIKPFQSHVTG